MVVDTPMMPEKLDLLVRRLIWLKAPKAPRHNNKFSHKIIWIHLPELPCFTDYMLHSHHKSQRGVD